MSVYQVVPCRVSGSSRDIILDYLPILRDRLTQPLIRKEPGEAVNEVLGIMQQYDLLKEDYDNIIDLTQWPGKPEIGKMIESKVIIHNSTSLLSVGRTG